jgi:hypothetical protein
VVGIVVEIEVLEKLELKEEKEKKEKEEEIIDDDICQLEKID